MQLVVKALMQNAILCSSTFNMLQTGTLKGTDDGPTEFWRTKDPARVDKQRITLSRVGLTNGENGFLIPNPAMKDAILCIGALMIKPEFSKPHFSVIILG